MYIAGLSVQHQCAMYVNDSAKSKRKRKKKKQLSVCWHDYCQKCQILFSRFNAYVQIPRPSISVERSIVEADNGHRCLQIHEWGERKTKTQSVCNKREKGESRQISRVSINIVRAFALSRQKRIRVRNTSVRVQQKHIPSAMLYK